MKNLTFFGIILLALGLILFYLNNYIWDLRFVYGALCGIGIGLIIGGVVGYFSKGKSIKAEQKKREFKQLQKEKQELLERQKLETKTSTSEIIPDSDITQDPF